MKSFINKKMLSRIFILLKWGKITAKFAAIGTTITGAITAFTSSSSATGIAMGAAGATTYAATKELAKEGYEKTKHVSPGPAIRGSLAARAIAEASMRKPEQGSPYVEEPVMKFKTFLEEEKPVKKKEPENPFAWTEEGAPPPPADAMQGSFAFLTQLNFVAAEKESGEPPVKQGRRSKDASPT
jgi:hypothetical protein